MAATSSGCGPEVTSALTAATAPLLDGKEAKTSSARSNTASKLSRRDIPAMADLTSVGSCRFHMPATVSAWQQPRGGSQLHNSCTKSLANLEGLPVITKLLALS